MKLVNNKTENKLLAHTSSRCHTVSLHAIRIAQQDRKIQP